MKKINYNISLKSRSKWAGFYYFIIGYILISPIIPHLGVSSKYIYLVLITPLLLLSFRMNHRLSLKLLIPLSIILLFSILGSIISSEWNRTGFSLIFVTSMLLSLLLGSKSVKFFTRIGTKFIVTLLYGAIFAQIYVMAGGSDIWSFPNPDGRLNYIFPATLTNSYWVGLIRPAGIYDEPGAFSFFICMTVVIRDLIGCNRQKSLYILLGGLLTFSIAHIVFLVCYIFSFKVSLSLYFKILLFMLSVMAIVYFFNRAEIVYDTFLIRFTITDHNTFHGDNRSDALINALSVIYDNPFIVITGSNPDSFNYLQKIYGELGANPLNLIIKLGILSAMPYYLTLFIFFSAILRGRRYLPLFGAGLLLLQRDYIFVISYSLLISTVLTLYLRSFINTIKNNTTRHTYG